MKRLNLLRLLKEMAILTNSVKSEEMLEISADFENSGSLIRLPPPPPTKIRDFRPLGYLKTVGK